MRAPARHFAATLALTLGLPLAAGCAASSTPAPGPTSARANSFVLSNVTRADFAGSASCAGCHTAITASWQRSPMRSMTRLASQVPVEPAFDGRTFAYASDRVTLTSTGGARYMRVERGPRTTLFRVTKLIGGRHRDDFTGVPLTGLSPDSPVDPAGEERVLPVSYLLATGTLRYKGYSVQLPERPYLGRGAVWRKTCIVCHNTLPPLSALYDDLLDDLAPLPPAPPDAGRDALRARDRAARARVYFGAISDRLLPADRRAEYHVTSEAGLRAALADEIGTLGDSPPRGADTAQHLTAALASTKERFDTSHLVEVGIGCEACHGGSREHVADPSVKPSYGLRSSFLTMTGPGGRELSRAEQVNRACARCHTVLFSGYRSTWEGGDRPAGGADSPDTDEETGAASPSARPPGGSTINSGEARDFLLGGCASKMACTDCHDPHAADGFGAHTGARDPASMVAVCQKCHSRYATPAALTAHTHHQADSPGSDCLNCHMPRKNMGLDYQLTRYHRVGSPTDPERVARDRPLECALCHDDKPARDLVDAMTAWYGEPFDRAALAAFYGPDLGENVLVATLARGKPHEQAVAAAVLASRKRRDLAPRLIPVLSNELPLVRYFARHALESLVGAPFPSDVGAPDPDRPTEATRWLAAHPDPAPR